MSHFCRNSAGHHGREVLRKRGRMVLTKKEAPRCCSDESSSWDSLPQHGRLERPSNAASGTFYCRNMTAG